MRSGKLARSMRGQPSIAARPEPVGGKQSPHDLDLEGAVLGTCITDETKLLLALESLQPEYFWSGPNEWIFGAMRDMVAAGVPVDVVSLLSALKERGLDQRVGGVKYLQDLMDGFASVRNIGAAAQRIYDLWRLRKVIDVCTKARAEAYSGDVGDKGEWIESVESQIYQIAHPVQKSDVQHVGVVLKSAFERIVAAAESGNRMRGISTGYERVDSILAGLHDGSLMLVAGRPGQGKTALAMNMAVNVASPRRAAIPDERAPNGHRDVDTPGFGVIVFSMEMPKEELSERMVCSEGRVDMERLRSGFLQPDDWRRLTEASQFLLPLPIWIDETPAISLLEARAKIRRIQAQWNRPATAEQPERRVGAVIFDYLQLMSGSGGADSREQEVAEISRGLKQLAKDFKVPVIALSQLNRAVETRSEKNKRPQLSDLRESGSLEQDADVVGFVHREEYYLKEHTPHELKGIAEFIVAKQRSGRTGKVILRFDGRCTRFDSLAPGDYPEALND